MRRPQLAPPLLGDFKWSKSRSQERYQTRSTRIAHRTPGAPDLVSLCFRNNTSLLLARVQRIVTRPERARINLQLASVHTVGRSGLRENGILAWAESVLPRGRPRHRMNKEAWQFVSGDFFVYFVIHPSHTKAPKSWLTESALWWVRDTSDQVAKSAKNVLRQIRDKWVECGPLDPASSNHPEPRKPTKAGL